MKGDAWKRSPDFIGWLKQPIAERYILDLREQRDEALQTLLGAAGLSDDPKVRERHATWKKLEELTLWLQNSRRESADGDDE